MCAPCKIILNNGGIMGTLKAMERAIVHLNKRGYDLDPDSYAKLQLLICGFHKELQDAERLITEGPYVPFEHKVIMPPNAKGENL